MVLEELYHGWSRTCGTDFKATCNLLPVVDLSLVLQARWDPGTELMFSLAEREDGTLQLRVYTLGI